MDPQIVQLQDGSFDVVMQGADLAPGNPLLNAIILSLFCDRRADPDDVLPDGPNGDRRGYWADAYADVSGDRWGSRLWLLERAVCDQDTLNRARDYATEALQWLIDDGVAKSIDIATSYPSRGRMTIAGTVRRPDGSRQDFAYDYVWRNLQNAIQ